MSALQAESLLHSPLAIAWSVAPARTAGFRPGFARLDRLTIGPQVTNLPHSGRYTAWHFSRSFHAQRGSLDID